MYLRHRTCCAVNIWGFIQLPHTALHTFLHTYAIAPLSCCLPPTVFRLPDTHSRSSILSRWRLCDCESSTEKVSTMAVHAKCFEWKASRTKLVGTLERHSPTCPLPIIQRLAQRRLGVHQQDTRLIGPSASSDVFFFFHFKLGQRKHIGIYYPPS